jgi:hypothetical protein
MTREFCEGAIQIIFAEAGLGEASGAAEQDFLQGPTVRLFRLFLEPTFRPPSKLLYPLF